MNGCALASGATPREAAHAAGYARRSLRRTAHALARHPNVRSAVQRLKADAASSEVTLPRSRDGFEQLLQSIANANIADLYAADGTLLPPYLRPPTLQHRVKRAETRIEYPVRNGAIVKTSVRSSVRTHSSLPCLQMIGKMNVASSEALREHKTPLAPLE